MLIWWDSFSHSVDCLIFLLLGISVERYFNLSSFSFILKIIHVLILASGKYFSWLFSHSRLLVFWPNFQSSLPSVVTTIGLSKWPLPRFPAVLLASSIPIISIPPPSPHSFISAILHQFIIFLGSVIFISRLFLGIFAQSISSWIWIRFKLAFSSFNFNWVFWINMLIFHFQGPIGRLCSDSFWAFADFWILSEVLCGSTLT